MLIKRLRVEEGFFNLLDLSFSEGLNVLVGGRGVGKTSVIELLRFGLGATNLSENAARESFSHAVSILQSSGRVIIDIEVNGQLLSISRSATEDIPVNLGVMPKPIIFSQKEVETVSLNSVGKLNLLDSFTQGYEHETLQMSSLASEIRSMCANLLHVRREYDEACEHTHKKTEILKHEALLQEQQSYYEKNNTLLTENQNKYNQLQKELSIVELDINSLTYLLNVFESRSKELKTLSTTPVIGASKSSYSLELANKANLFFDEEKNLIAELIHRNITFTEELKKELSNLFEQKNTLEVMSREYRGDISKVTESAGLILSSLNNIRNQLSNIASWEDVANNKKIHLTTIYEQIQGKLEALTKIRELIYKRRSEICERLNGSLNPMVKIEINYSSDNSYYIEALKSTLKGSGLRYNEVVDGIASKIQPQWLFYYIFSEKYSDFSEMVDMPYERAARLLSYFREVDLGALLSAQINDEVNLFLLDKGSYKKVEELSIGQRCTVALSLILENNSRILIIDQPEDHLDNEFITSTLIKSLSKRASAAQTIISSHNANIPVLGEAKLVVNLDSNGRRGFIKHTGPIQQEDIKAAIESIMEGGKEAFQLRSHFYSGN